MVSSGGAYRFAVFGSDVGDRVGGGVGRGYNSGEVSGSRGQVCWVAEEAGMRG
ncbi:MAG TPA: hypothetical protein VEH31_14490 [Streptosporangiaceae bacterium]|nr:hypothetical protein [Streptosporangiaceae bacterium]HYA50428.1 hypothetical protein [Streptosporangiaceae bacterium]